MATNYPTSIDTVTELPASGGVGSDLDDFPHSALHGNANDAIRAIETELGTAPKGTYGSVKARLDDIQARHGCSLSRSTNQTLASGGNTDISFTTEDADTDGYFSAPGTTVTIPADLGGVYAITATFDTDVTTLDNWRLVADGVFYRFAPSGGEAGAGTLVLPLAAGDTIYVRLVNGATAGNISTASLHVYRIYP